MERASWSVLIPSQFESNTLDHGIILHASKEADNFTFPSSSANLRCVTLEKSIIIIIHDASNCSALNQPYEGGRASQTRTRVIDSWLHGYPLHAHYNYSHNFDVICSLSLVCCSGDRPGKKLMPAMDSMSHTVVSRNCRNSSMP